MIATNGPPYLFLPIPFSVYSKSFRDTQILAPCSAARSSDIRGVSVVGVQIDQRVRYGGHVPVLRGYERLGGMTDSRDLVA